MRILICGATGCIGRTLLAALRAHGHTVVAGSRRAATAPDALVCDYNADGSAGDWAARLREAGGFDVVINAVGILMEGRDAGGQVNCFERVHAAGPIALFQGAAQAGVARIVQISALGIAGGLTPYARTKLRADEALQALAAVTPQLDAVVVRPSLVYGPRSQSAALFRSLAGLPVIALPGRGQQRVQPLHVAELAEAVCRMVESRQPLPRLVELAGPQVLSYRDMLTAYRRAQGLADPIWLPVPMPLMQLGARLAQALPQQVFSPDTLLMLEQGHTTAHHHTRDWLGREPTAIGDALGGPPVQGQLLAVQRLLLRATIAAMWLITAGVTAALPNRSGVLHLLARCGLAGELGVAVMWASCLLNLFMGTWLLLRPAAWCYVLQVAAVLGYTSVAAWNMPELLIDHCGPLLKNLPVLGMLLMLWWTEPARARPANNGLHETQAGRPERRICRLHVIRRGAGQTRLA